MKNLLLIAVLSAFILSSCSQKFSVSKRRYNKGFHWTASKSRGALQKSHKLENKKLAPAQSNIPETDAVASLNITKQTELQQNNFGITIKNKEIDNNRKKISKNQVNPFLANNTQTSDRFKVSNFKTKTEFRSVEYALNNTVSNKKDQSSDTKLVLCVIIAIFIPPLGMFLWKQNADIWFIVDLILFLFMFTWFYWGGPGLIGLAAIVIALFRIFDLI